MSLFEMHTVLKTKIQEEGKTYKKIPLAHGEINRLAADLDIHRNTLLKRWKNADPRTVYAVAMRQAEHNYPADVSFIHNVKSQLVKNYLRRTGQKPLEGEI